MASTFQTALLKAKAKKKRPTPADPPVGTYDPQFDAQGRNIQRNYDDLVQNFGISKGRSQDDLGIALANLDQSRQQGLEDLTTSRSRNLADLLTGRTRATEDHASALANLDRNYSMLANKQGQAARQAHVESGGILAQALAKRQANQAHDQQPIDQSYQRTIDNSNLSQSRLEEDFTRGTSRLGTEATQKSDALKLAFDRAFGPSGDNVLNLARAGRDLNAGQLDLTSSKWYSATANGYVPISPTKKKKRPMVY